MEIEDKVNILLVDDKPENLLSLAAILVDPCYNLIKAHSGQEALKHLLDQEFAVILLDVQMPIMDGFETATFIRGRERLRHTPIIFLTANNCNDNDTAKGYSLGAVDYIYKPIVPHILQSKVAVFIDLHRKKHEIERLRQIEQRVYERERLENLEALRQSEEQYRLLFENNSQPMWVFALDDLSFLAVNTAAIQSYGFSREEFLKMTVKDIRPVEDIPDLLDKVSRLKSKLNTGNTVRHRKKCGEIINVEITSYPVTFLQRQARFVLATDVTEKKRIEAQFLRAQRMENIGILASGIAHDLNNVLAPVLMSVQVLKRRVKDEQSQSILTTLETSAQRGANLVKHVLSFGRGVDGQRSLIQVKHLIDEIEKVIKETFAKSITIQSNVVENLWLFSGDSTQLHQILMNLCINARDAMPKGGTLTISANNFLIDENYTRMHTDAQIGPYIVIIVTDTGTGISDQIINQIFDPFFTTKELGKGTGLGLSTVRSIVKNEGGFINVYSEMGKGTQFKVFLPAVETTETKQEEVDQYDLPSGNGELILVVDDEASIREITKTTLEAYNYRVITATDGIEAIARYAEKKHEINLVLSDMMMPSMDGPTTIRTLLKLNSEVKVIAVSGLSSRDKVSEMTSLGVTNFLCKPYTAEELLTTIHKLLSQQSPISVN